MAFVHKTSHQLFVPLSVWEGQSCFLKQWLKCQKSNHSVDCGHWRSLPPWWSPGAVPGDRKSQKREAEAQDPSPASTVSWGDLGSHQNLWSLLLICKAKAPASIFPKAFLAVTRCGLSLNKDTGFKVRPACSLAWNAERLLLTTARRWAHLDLKQLRLEPSNSAHHLKHNWIPLFRSFWC